ASGGQSRRVPGEDDDENQGRSGADRIERNQESELPVDRRAQDAAGDGVEHETTDARDQAACEEDGVLPDQPVLAELDQALPEVRSGAGLHSPPDCTQGVAKPLESIITSDARR